MSPPRPRAAAEAVLKRMPEGALPLVTAADRARKRPYWRRVRAWRERLEESQWWEAEQLAAYQLEQLRGLVAHALSAVPHYRGLDAEPGDIRTLEDLRRLPTLSKADLQEHGDELLADGWPEEAREYVTTGGSTGVPVGFWMDKTWSLAAEWAFISMLWRRVGYRDGDRTATLRGEPPAGGALWRVRPHMNDLHLSSYHLTDEHLPALVERLRSFRPRFLLAYPSSSALLADHMLRAGEGPIEGLEAVLCGSENVYDWQRERIEHAFERRVFSWYGQSERVSLAGECEHSRALHVFPEYGITELIDGEGRPIEEPGRVGEVVGTPFATRSMPLIRYRTGDAAAWADGPCDLCGRAYRRFERIEGRLQEFIVSAGGRPISMTAINFHTGVFDNVRQFRFYQDTPGEVVLRVVPKPAWRDQADERRIRAEMAPKLGADTRLVAIECVDEIPVGRSGKFQFLEQRLPIRLGDS